MCNLIENFMYVVNWIKTWETWELRQERNVIVHVEIQ